MINKHNGGDVVPPRKIGVVNLIVTPRGVVQIMMCGIGTCEHSPMDWTSILDAYIDDPGLIPSDVIVKVRTLEDLLAAVMLRSLPAKGSVC